MLLNELLINKKTIYIVGVSGGSDSIALLDLLHKNNYNVVVAHVNYHVRHDSDEDQRLVQDYCLGNNIKLHIKEIKGEDYEDENFEMQARIMRYDFYQELCDLYQTKYVILGHHQDDVLETIIMQLDRKNTKSYLGIQEVSHIKNMNIIRPLLNNQKQMLRIYCVEHNLQYHDDYTNFNNDYTRNNIRNNILVHYSDDQKQELLSKALEHNQIIKKRDELLQPLYQEYDLYKKINYRKIKKESLEPLIYHMLKKVVYPPLITENLIQEILKQIDSKKPNIRVNLPVNAVFIKEYDNIYVLKNETGQHYSYIYNKLTYDHHDYFYLSDHGHINEGILLEESDFPITIRTYLPGDKISTSGGTKKVSRLFIDKKIPAQKRKTWPIVINRQGEVILIPNIAKNKEYLYSKPNIFVVKLEQC